MDIFRSKEDNPARGISGRLLCDLFLLMTILFFVFASLEVRFYRAKTEEDFVKVAASYSKVAARMVRNADIKKYVETKEKDENWYTTKLRLDFLVETGTIKYVYIVIPMEEGYLYIWDAGKQEGVCDLGDFDQYYSGGDVVMKEAFAAPAGDIRMMVSNHPLYGYVVSVFTPVYNSRDELVALSCVDLDLNEINEDIAEFLKYSIGLLVILMLLATIGFYLQTNRLIVRPVKKLERLAAGYVNDQMTHGVVLEPDIHTGVEIEALANAISSMSSQIRNYISDLEKAIKAEETVRAELDVSRRIQEALLPREFPAFPELEYLDLYASMDPAREVGGDFYDFFRIDENRIAFCIADVSGKGIPAALFMAYSKTLIQIGARSMADPGEMFTMVNRELCENNEADMFVTAFFAVLDLRTMQLTYVNAGHCPPLLRHAGEDAAYMKMRPGFVLAGIDTVKYRCEKIILKPGDELILYTDGVTEAMNEAKELFGEARLLETVNENRGVSCKDLILQISSALEVFVGTAPQFDDITMLAVRLLPESGDIQQTNEKI